MKLYEVIVEGDLIILSEEEILREYWYDYSQRIIKRGEKPTEKDCIADYVKKKNAVEIGIP